MSSSSLSQPSPSTATGSMIISDSAGTAPPLARWQQAALGALAPAAALSLAAWGAVIPFAVSDPPEVWIPAVAAAPHRVELALGLLVLFGLTASAGALVVGSLARRGAPRLGTVALVVAFLGYTAASLDLLAYDGLALTAVRGGVDAAALLEGYESIGAVAVAGPLFLLMPLGTLLLGVALWVGRTVPRWAAAAMVVGILLVPVGGFLANAVLTAGWLLVAAGTAGAGAVYARS